MDFSIIEPYLTTAGVITATTLITQALKNRISIDPKIICLIVGVGASIINSFRVAPVTFATVLQGAASGFFVAVSAMGTFDLALKSGSNKQTETGNREGVVSE